MYYYNLHISINACKLIKRKCIILNIFTLIEIARIFFLDKLIQKN